MCWSNVYPQPAQDAAKKEHGPRDYSHVFLDVQTKRIIRRALLLRRLVNDPFYRIMNVSDAARLWMLRHLALPAEHVKLKYNLNLKQFFDFMGETYVLKYLRYKGAPNEILVMWQALFPPRARRRVNYKRCAPKKRQA